MSTPSTSTSTGIGPMVDNQFQFAEMNLRHTGNADRTLAMVRRAVRMGYDTVVINVDVGDLKSSDTVTDPTDSEPPKKKKKKGGGGGQRAKVIPEPFQVDPTKLNLTDLEQQGRRFRQFSRITLSLTDSGSVHTMMHHSVVKRYDLLAVRINSELILQTLVVKGDCVDLITFDPVESKIPWLQKGKLVQQALERGLGFELTYAAALKDSSERRQVFSNGRQLIAATRGGRGVVLASGAEDLLDIRAPYDTANLGVLFGCKPAIGRSFVSANAKRVLLRCEAKKSIRGAIHVTEVDPKTAPTPLWSRKSALERLLAVPEFRAQIQIAGPMEKLAKEAGDGEGKAKKKAGK